MAVAVRPRVGQPMSTTALGVGSEAAAPSRCDYPACCRFNVAWALGNPTVTLTSLRHCLITVCSLTVERPINEGGTARSHWRAAQVKSGRHHGCNRGDDLATSTILNQQETEMVAYSNTTLRRRLQASACHNPLPVITRTTPPGSRSRAAATFV